MANLSMVTQDCANSKDVVTLRQSTVFQSISIVPISREKPGSVAQQSNWYSTAKSMKQFRNINGPLGMMVSMRERPIQRDVSSDVS